jgi:hypothetical protein
MTQQQHILEIYEPYDYQGLNPLVIGGVALLDGPLRNHYYLLELDNPLRIQQQQIRQLLVSPRYNGDRIERAVSSTCTVNISRVAPGTDLTKDSSLSYEEIERWGVGKISPQSIP